MGNTEIVTGTLTGMGHEVECRLMVTGSELRGSVGPAFSSCGILDAPSYLPDGYYQANFSSHSAFLHRANGCWSMGVPWRDLPAAQTIRTENVA